MKSNPNSLSSSKTDSTIRLRSENNNEHSKRKCNNIIKQQSRCHKNTAQKI